MTAQQPYRTIEDLPPSLALFPLSGVLLLPRGQLPLNIFEPRYLAMIDDAMSSDRLVGMIQPVLDQTELVNDADAKPQLQNVGCAGRITSYAETGDGRYVITLTGACRFALGRELPATTLYRKAQVDFKGFALDLEAGHGADKADKQAVIEAFRTYAKARDLKIDWQAVEDAPCEALVNGLSMASPFGLSEKQALLEAADLKTRAETLIALSEMALAAGGEQDETTLQ
jgi:Lon protease-like protein